MMPSKTASALATLVLAAGVCSAAVPALAEEGPIASARVVDTADATDAQIREYLDDAASIPGEAGPRQAAAPDRQPHGEVGVGIGTGGYRHAHAATVVPVGDIGTAAIAVSDTRYNGRFGPRKQQSLSVAVNLGDGARPAAPDCVRAPEGRGRGLEPMWVTRMRADQATSAGAACVPR